MFIFLSILIILFLGALVFILNNQHRRKDEVTNVFKDQLHGLQSQNDHLQAIINSLGYGLFVLDKARRVVLFNKSAERALGYLAEDLVGKGFNQILRDFSLEGENNQGFFDHAYLRNSRNERLPVSIMASVNDNGHIILAFRHISSELELSRAKSNMLSDAAGQLRTQLDSIRWVLDLFNKGDLGKVSQKQTMYMAEAFDSVAKMAKTIDDITKVSNNQ